MPEETKIEVQENDILKEINDSYTRNKKRKNMIAFSIISAIVLLFSVLVVTFGAIRINTKPTTFAEPTKFTIKISDNTTSLDPTDDKYDEFYKLYLKSFETSYLTALFTGSLGGYEIKETTDEFYSSYSSNTRVGSGISSSLSGYLGSNYVHLHYAEEQTLYSSNGQAYYSNRNTEDYLLTFFDVYFSPMTENNFGEVTFYIGTYGYAKKPNITKITVNGNTNALYNFAEEL